MVGKQGEGGRRGGGVKKNEKCGVEGENESFPT